MSYSGCTRAILRLKLYPRSLARASVSLSPEAGAKRRRERSDLEQRGDGAGTLDQERPVFFG
jgi:hypothetical protein